MEKYDKVMNSQSSLSQREIDPLRNQKKKLISIKNKFDKNVNKKSF